MISAWDRWLVKNLDRGSDVSAKYLSQQYPDYEFGVDENTNEIVYAPKADVAAKKDTWQPIDPHGFDAADIGDVALDAVETAASIPAMFAGPYGNAAVSGGLEATKDLLARGLMPDAYKPSIADTATAVGANAALGAAVPKAGQLLAKGGQMLGKGAVSLAKKTTPKNMASAWEYLANNLDKVKEMANSPALESLAEQVAQGIEGVRGNAKNAAIKFENILRGKGSKQVSTKAAQENALDILSQKKVAESGMTNLSPKQEAWLRKNVLANLADEATSVWSRVGQKGMLPSGIKKTVYVYPTRNVSEEMAANFWSKANPKLLQDFTEAGIDITKQIPITTKGMLNEAAKIPVQVEKHLSPTQSVDKLLDFRSIGKEAWPFKKDRTGSVAKRAISNSIGEVTKALKDVDKKAMKELVRAETLYKEMGTTKAMALGKKKGDNVPAVKNFVKNAYGDTEKRFEGLKKYIGEVATDNIDGAKIADTLEAARVAANLEGGKILPNVWSKLAGAAGTGAGGYLGYKLGESAGGNTGGYYGLGAGALLGGASLAAPFQKQLYKNVAIPAAKQLEAIGKKLAEKQKTKGAKVGAALAQDLAKKIERTDD